MTIILQNENFVDDTVGLSLGLEPVHGESYFAHGYLKLSYVVFRRGVKNTRTRVGPFTAINSTNML